MSFVGVGVVVGAQAHAGGASLPAPTVDAVAPNVGGAAGGTSVRITGSGFTGATGATLGGVAMTSFVVVDDTTITGLAGAGAAGTALDVVVTRGAAATFAGAWTYLPAGAVLFLHADLGLTMNGDTVAAWADQSGAGHSVAQGTAILQPMTTPDALNGRGTVNFDGTQFLDFVAWATLTGLHIFVLGMNADDGDTASAPLVITSCPSAEFVPFVDRKIYSEVGSSARKSTGFAPPAGAWAAPWLLEWVATADEWTLRFNGAQAATYDSNTYGEAYRHVGTDPAEAVYMFGDIRVILAYPSKLSTADQAIVQAYLKAEGGIP